MYPSNFCGGSKGLLSFSHDCKVWYMNCNQALFTQCNSWILISLLSLLQEFFTEDLWHTLPSSWQPVLQDLSYPQIADLLLDATHEDRRYYWIVIRPFIYP